MTDTLIGGLKDRIKKYSEVEYNQKKCRINLCKLEAKLEKCRNDRSHEELYKEIAKIEYATKIEKEGKMMTHNDAMMTHNDALKVERRLSGKTKFGNDECYIEAIEKVLGESIEDCLMYDSKLGVQTYLDVYYKDDEDASNDYGEVLDFINEDKRVNLRKQVKDKIRRD